MDDDPIERWWATTPEPKLELIDGRLVVSSIAGSRRIAWTLLQDYGPALALPFASRDLWWVALHEAFAPQPVPQTPDAWIDWATALTFDAEPPPAGPFGSAAHRGIYQVLRFGLYSLEGAGLGRSLGRDFVIRLGEDGLTPDLLFIERNRLPSLHEYHLDGPPSVVIEITLEATAQQDRTAKRALYERGGVPEYWVFEPDGRQASFWLLGGDGRYRQVFPDGDQIYRSPAVPDLALSLPHLWSMDDTDWERLWRPFLPVSGYGPIPRPKGRQPNELGWGTVPFAPRVDLHPVRITFDEYISWCPEAKFERYGGGTVIGGDEGTRHVMGMLLMTFGLRHVVRLAHPAEWVRCLTAG